MKILSVPAGNIIKNEMKNRLKLISRFFLEEKTLFNYKKLVDNCVLVFFCY